MELVGNNENEKGIVRSIENLELTIENGKNAKSSKYERRNGLKKGDVVVEVSSNYYRPTEVDYLIGDARKAKEKLGWEAKVRFEELVKVMMEADLEKTLRKGY